MVTPICWAGVRVTPNLGVFTYDAALDTISAVRVLAFDPLELRAVRGMSSIAGQDSIWVNEFEFNLRKVSLTTGETGTIVPEGVFTDQRSTLGRLRQCQRS